MIKNIVFDIGNVLVRFQPDEAMREIGIEENKIAALAHATYVQTQRIQTVRQSRTRLTSLQQRLIVYQRQQSSMRHTS